MTEDEFLDDVVTRFRGRVHRGHLIMASRLIEAKRYIETAGGRLSWVEALLFGPGETRPMLEASPQRSDFDTDAAFDQALEQALACSRKAAEEGGLALWFEIGVEI